MTIDSESAKFTRSLRSAIVLPVGVILLAALLLLLLVFELFDLIKWSDRSYEIIGHARASERLMIDMETGVRGYLLQNDRSFLEPYVRASAEIDPLLRQLKQDEIDNPEQSVRVDEIIRLKETWMDHAQSSIAQKERGEWPGGEWNRMGKNIMDEVRGAYNRFLSAEETLRHERQERLVLMKHVLGYVGVALAFILSITVALHVRRQFFRLARNYRRAVAAVEDRHDALQRSQKELEEQKEWFRVTLASIGDGVIVTDRDGRIVFMNEESERLTGWKSPEALLKPLSSIFKIVNEENRRALDDPVTRVLAEKKVIGMANHSVLISRNGVDWPIEDSAAPIYDSKKQLLGVVLVFHNASEMRSVQKELRAYSEELEKKVADRTLTLQQTVTELEAFSYTVSHDLRSPLRAMQGFAEAMIEDYGEKLDTQGRDYLERIKNASERLDRLIQDLLSYTRLSRHEAPLIELDLDKLARDVMANYPNLQAPAAEVRIEGTLPRVIGKEGALIQVMSNLLGNAAKFVPQGRKPNIRIWAEDKGPRSRIWIEDNGIGISPKNHARIFDMFVQVNDSQLYGGTGVGLAIVKKAVQTMSGDVGVESQDGQGSRFWFELNRAKI